MDNITTYKGPGLLTLLTVLFVGLKLAGYISWSWWWALSPLILQVGIVVTVFLIFAVIGILVGILE